MERSWPPSTGSCKKKKQVQNQTNEKFEKNKRYIILHPLGRYNILNDQHSSSSSSHRPLEVRKSDSDVQLWRVAQHDHASLFRSPGCSPRRTCTPNYVVPDKPHG